MNYIKMYKNGQLDKNINSLNQTCKYFLNEYIFNEVLNEFLENKVPNESGVVKSMKKICRLEENSLYLPYEEITNILNFSIYAEREQILEKIENEKSTSISKLSLLLKEGRKEPTYNNEEEIYTIQEVKDFLIEKCKLVSSDVVDKNSNIIISFI